MSLGKGIRCTESHFSQLFVYLLGVTRRGKVLVLLRPPRNVTEVFIRLDSFIISMIVQDIRWISTKCLGIDVGGKGAREETFIFWRWIPMKVTVGFVEAVHRTENHSS